MCKFCVCQWRLTRPPWLSLAPKRRKRGQPPRRETGPAQWQTLAVGGSCGRLWFVSVQRRLRVSCCRKGFPATSAAGLPVTSAGVLPSPTCQPALPPGARHTTTRVRERIGKRLPRLTQDAMRPGQGSATGKALGGWRKAQFGQGGIPGNCRMTGKYRERSAATGYASGYGGGGNRVAGMSVRLAGADRPEHVEPAATLLVFNSYAAVVTGQPESVSVPAAM